MSKIDDILVDFYNRVEPDVHATNGGTVYTKAGTEAKQALYKDMVELIESIGTSDHTKGSHSDDSTDKEPCYCILSQELRNKLKEYYGIDV